MRKPVLLLLLLMIAISISWSLFRQSNLEVSHTSKLPITVSMPLLRNLAEEIGRDEVAVTSIIKGTNCNHEYEPASGDLRQASRSAVFIKVGLGFDLWADKLIAGVAAENRLVIDASQGVTAIEDEHHGHGEDAGHEVVTDGGSANPHYWGNPEHVKIMAQNILEGLIKVLPEKQDYFTRNYQEYLAKVDQTVGEIKTELAGVPSRRIVSYTAAFPYFYQYFGFENLATVESTCEQEVSPRHLAEVITLARANQVKVVVGEAVYPKLPENLAKEAGAKLVLLWTSTNESGDYLATLKENVEMLVAAFQ